MPRLTPGLALILAACAAPVPEAVSYRDAGAAISSSALFDPGRFAGDWHLVAAYGGEAACGVLPERWQATGQGRFRVDGRDCAGGRVRDYATEAALVGPGRIARGGETMWILWVDADYRVAAVGTPSGAFGRVLSRDPRPRPDLLRAAREVLDFNGYDLSRLAGTG